MKKLTTLVGALFLLTSFLGCSTEEKKGDDKTPGRNPIVITPVLDGDSAQFKRTPGLIDAGYSTAIERDGLVLFPFQGDTARFEREFFGPCDTGGYFNPHTRNTYMVSFLPSVREKHKCDDPNYIVR